MFCNSRWRLDGYMEASTWDFASLNGQCLTFPCVRCSKSRVLQNALHAVEIECILPSKHAFLAGTLNLAVCTEHMLCYVHSVDFFLANLLQQLFPDCINYCI